MTARRKLALDVFDLRVTEDWIAAVGLMPGHDTSVGSLDLLPGLTMNFHLGVRVDYIEEIFG